MIELKKNLKVRVKQLMKWVTSAQMSWVGPKTENVNLETVSVRWSLLILTLIFSSEEEELKKPSPRKVLLSTPPVLNHSVPFISPVIKTFAPENIKTPPTTEPAPQTKASDTSTSETPVNNSTEENFDSAALSDLEDISPERESEPDEDPSDPFSDFVPEEQKEEEKISKDPEVKEPEYENFSPEPPVFDDPPEEPEASEQPKELSKDLAEPQFSTVKEQLQDERWQIIRTLEWRSRSPR